MSASRASHRLALVVIATAQLMVMLDLTIVNIALPAIQRELHFSTTNLTWVIDAYVLAFGGLLLLGGRTGDLFGRRRMFSVGIALFAAASLAGGLATDQAFLIVARALQGIGAAVASPTALALIATTFEEGTERNRAMAIYAGMSAAGGALGLLLGGILVDVASWRWVLFVNVPIGAAVLLLAPMSLPRPAGPPNIRRRLDVPGALTVSAGTALLVYGLVRSPTSGWSSAGTIAAFVAAAVVLAAFAAIEAFSQEPLVPLRFLAHRNRAAGYGTMLLLGAAMLSLIFFLTQFLQDVLHYSPVLAGVAYLPIPIAVAATSLVVSRLLHRLPLRLFPRIGPVLVTGGLFWSSFVSASSSYLDIFGPLVIVGVGMGLSFMPLTLNAVSSVERHESGLASALLNTSQQVGGSLGLAALVTIAASAARDELKHLAALAQLNGISSPAKPHAAAVAAMVHGDQMALRAAAVAAALAFCLSLFLRTGRAGEARDALSADSSDTTAAPLEQVALDAGSAKT
jgi:EmrB/QacA subfamily drug resistance transporter